MDSPRAAGAARRKAWERGLPASELGEFGVIEQLRSVLAGVPVAGTAVGLGIGDDAALLKVPAGGELIATCDIQLEGRHFRRDWLSPREVGSRAAEVSLSDVAAMGGRPLAALVSLGLPGACSVGALEDIYCGIGAALEHHGAVVAGGNISGAETLFLDLTLLGWVAEGRALKRGGARPGELVFVTGRPGQAAAAVAALRAGEAVAPELRERLRALYAAPAAQIRAGQHLVENEIAGAVIDQSDGLAGDLQHVCRASGVGVILDEALLPLDDDLRRLAALLDCSPLDWILGASDDYGLIFTAARSAVDQAFALAAVAELPVTLIGEVVSGAEVILRNPSGELSRFPAGGWDHLK